MSKEIYISSTPHETRLAIVESDELTEIYYERENEYTLAGSIYNGRVTRVLPGMQSSFVDIGLERDAFLYITDFMEDEADTAEFDHTGDATPRPARVEGQRSASRGERNEGDSRESGRGGRESNGYVSERNLEQASATPASDAAKASEGRGEEFGGRGDRNGRGRGRGRRDRGGSGERTGGTERPLDREAESRFVEATPVFEPVLEEDEVLLPAEAIVPSEGSGVELGEGAPGADGSRRWRGRRGRRRGRGTGTREAGDDAQAAVPVAEEASGGRSAEFTDSMPAEPFVVPTATVIVEVGTDEPARGERQGGPSERGGRGQAGLRAPRGFAPRRSLYGVESEAEGEETPSDEPVGSLAASGSEPEPLILPGESLSKYRKGGDTAETPARSAVTASSLLDSGFKVDPNWDGGAMLPGETLSRYRGGATQAVGSQPSSDGRSEGRRPDGRREGGRGDDQGRSRDGRRDGRDGGSPDRARSGRDGQENVQGRGLGRQSGEPVIAPALAPASDLQSGGPVAGHSQMNEQREEFRAVEPDFAHSELPEATAEAAGVAHTADASHGGELERLEAARGVSDHQTPSEQEYEPEGESASYRIDTAAPSEYRLQGGLAQVEEEAAEEHTEQAEVHVRVAPSGELFALETAAKGSIQPEVHARSGISLTSLPAGLKALPFGTRAAGMRLPLAGDGAAQSHELTKVDAMGAMHSEAPELYDVEATVPIGFAPGTGDLEEDFIEEEETETTSLYAQSDEEFDDLEEEHLEGTADLGTMIRDMTVDQITRVDVSLGEDHEEFEEDEVEEGFEDHSQTSGERGGFAAEPRRSFEDETSGERRPGTAEPSGGREDGYARASSADRRGRDTGRDSGRRGNRDRNGGREGGNRNGRNEHSGSGETNGYSSDRSASDRSAPDRSGLGERARNTGGSSDRDRGRTNGRGGRQSAQMTNLPAISDLLKPGQEILCQIAKEPMAKKGARITSHIALPGRFLVFMPTVSHTGVSRKIESDGERRRLKEILMSEKGEAAGGFIVRTAAAGATEAELRSDLRFLLNLWSDIKQRSESSKSPALIYHDLNLVERILRDQVTDSFSAIWVDTETEYERVLRFLQRFQPGLIRRVKLYTKETPLFEQFGITEEINKALRSKVWLKSGGSIVINQTEALVAIDINTGKYVGKTARLEDTIVKTNLDAIPEIVRQIRLRDLGGIIIIDFIDMDERKNRNRVMQALEDELKTDRAPSKVLPFNDFGLVAITRKRVKQSLERTLSTTCGVCTGTGMVKSPVTVCNDIYVEMRKMHKHLDRGDVMLRVHPEVVKQLKSTGTRWLQEMEEMCGKTILIKSDPALHPEQFDIH